MRTPEPRPVPARSHRIAAVCRRHVWVFLNDWAPNTFPFLFEPLVFFLAIGVGMSQFVGDMEGLSYLVFLAPGQIMISVAYATVFECTYGTWFRLDTDQNYDAMVVTPVSARDVFWGEILFSAIKGAAFALITIGVLYPFGVIRSPWAAAIPVVGFFTGASFAGLALWATSFVRTIQNFNFVISGMFTPLILFSAVFYPITALPEVMQTVARVLPFYYPVHLTRMMTTGVIQSDWPVALLYTVAVPGLLGYLGVRRMSKRLMG